MIYGNEPPRFFFFFCIIVLIVYVCQSESCISFVSRIVKIWKDSQLLIIKPVMSQKYLKLLAY